MRYERARRPSLSDQGGKLLFGLYGIEMDVRRRPRPTRASRQGLQRASDWWLSFARLVLRATPRPKRLVSSTPRMEEHEKTVFSKLRTECGFDEASQFRVPIPTGLHGVRGRQEARPCA